MIGYYVPMFSLFFTLSLLATTPTLAATTDADCSAIQNSWDSRYVSELKINTFRWDTKISYCDAEYDTNYTVASAVWALDNSHAQITNGNFQNYYSRLSSLVNLTRNREETEEQYAFCDNGDTMLAVPPGSHDLILCNGFYFTYGKEKDEYGRRIPTGVPTLEDRTIALAHEGRHLDIKHDAGHEPCKSGPFKNMTAACDAELKAVDAEKAGGYSDGVHYLYGVLNQPGINSLKKDVTQAYLNGAIAEHFNKLTPAQIRQYSHY